MARNTVELSGSDTAQHVQKDGAIINQYPSGVMTAKVILEDEGRSDLERQYIIKGNAHFHRLGWKRLTVVSIVEGIALGSLGLPYAFATLGMVAGVIMTVGLGFVAMYASYQIGQVKLKYPAVAHYADVGRLLMGDFGSKIFIGSFVALLIFVVGSHCLTGAIAFKSITQSDLCSVVFSIISAAILMILAIPPSFADVAILGYIDFASIIIAIGVTMIATGIQKSNGSITSAIGYSAWSAWPKDGITFSEAIVSTNSIVFAYSFGGCLPSFMEEMHTPEDYVKTLWWLGGIQIVIYTMTGSIIYAFVGQTVQSPALLSAGPVISRVVFGIALPVIFISGSINTTVVCRYIHGKVYKNSVVRFVNTPKGWATWLGLVFTVTLIGWGAWYEKHNLKTSMYNLVVFLVGMIVFGCGTYASFAELVHKFESNSISKPFTCST
ncbi:transmembrane amino acid transporter protein-domain-containing protein [Aspergillus leporis]|uniref:Transmembrane amino acid transporter protein-domain-containing protein n=1 Tax=Aspergillus leporis TaxID=41062 RepID=A0A5N5X6Z9_9EURO|nr:transmembrane amino acid transporter protein-domain-containing protein [Aspergillus leporis]